MCDCGPLLNICLFWNTRTTPAIVGAADKWFYAAVVFGRLIDDTFVAICDTSCCGVSVARSKRLYSFERQDICGDVVCLVVHVKYCTNLCRMRKIIPKRIIMRFIAVRNVRIVELTFRISCKTYELNNQLIKIHILTKTFRLLV